MPHCVGSCWSALRRLDGATTPVFLEGAMATVAVVAIMAAALL